MIEVDNTFLLSAPILLVLLTLATCDDILEHRIPNVVVIWGIVLAFGIGSLTGGLPGFLSALGGMALGGMLLLPFYLLGGMGAGDVKLMAMAGAFLGPGAALLAVVVTLTAGFVLALALLGVWLIRQSSFGRVAASTAGSLVPARLQASDPGTRPTRFPYAAAISVGSTVALWWPALGTAAGMGG